MSSGKRGALGMPSDGIGGGCNAERCCATDSNWYSSVLQQKVGEVEGSYYSTVVAFRFGVLPAK